jgi:hypothetical protein
VRGDDGQRGPLFSYLSPEQRVPADHPLRAIRTMTDEALRRMSPRFDAIYATTGRPSILPEHLLRALLLQVLYSVRSERMLMEQLEYKQTAVSLVYLGEKLMEDRHGLIVDACVVPATETGERAAATSLIARLPHRRVTIGGDEGYDTRGFVETVRTLHAVEDM